MTISHHPGDDVLLDLAAGRLAAGPALLASVHARMCPQCAARLRALEAAGGVLLESSPPQPLRADAFALVMERIAAPAAQGFAQAALPPPAVRRAPAETGVAESGRPDWPEGAPWPAGLDGCRFGPWKWIAPGMRWSRLLAPPEAAANVFLLRIGPGRSLPSHTHGGVEWTQVLHGRFHDGHALFGPGDFDAADGSIHHQPVVQGTDDCICLAAVDGRLRFDGLLARLAGSLVGL